MKKAFVLFACVVALALAAAAQEDMNFADMPLVSLPSLMPNGYGGMNWNNIFYIDPHQWSGSGPGYMHGPVGRDVVFIGGKICRLMQEACYGTISSPGGPMGFQPVSVVVAGGFGATYIFVTAYNNGSYVGQMAFPLGTEMRTLKFPASWGSITQLVFMTTGGGDLVIYDMQLYKLGG